MEPWRVCLLLAVIYIPGGTAAPPTKRPQLGPCVGMDCMHGILMHGDAEGGDSHRQEDDFKARQEAEEARLKLKDKKSGPCEGSDCLHDLMHADGQDGAAHMHQKMGPEKEKAKAGPGEGMDFLHGVMMHGDDKPGRKHDDDHRKLTKPPSRGDGDAAQDGPCVGMDCLHGVLMHSDTEAGKDHADEHAHDQKRLLEKSGRKFASPDPEAAMHGGNDDPDHVHSADNKAPILDKHKGTPSISDPNEAINGHLNGQIKLKPAEDDDSQDYQEWLKNSKNVDSAKDNKGGFLGFSFPFISDSLLDEIEILKRRYLPKFWGGSDVKEPKQKAPSDGEKKDSVHDLLADLEVVGGTAPLDANHHHHHAKRPQGGDKEGSGVKHDEG